jgi:tRNA nucleotidyltransferase (CCA-adding enzyme)
MQTYLVGGAVRDGLLGRPFKDHDYVVVGATPKYFLDLGYEQVGKNFPVFLHPTTKAEYALARLERKVAEGHTGFECDASPKVTLEEDLERRDLTINAIAQDDKGALTDPFNGQGDIKNRVLRHVSSAFSEDPLRVLRVARFYAQLAEFDFTIAKDTMTLMSNLVDFGELKTLSAERIWQECSLALSSAHPAKFFEALRDCGAHEPLFPNIGDMGLIALTQAAKTHEDLLQRVGALFYKNATFSKWVKPPTALKEFSKLVNHTHVRIMDASHLTKAELLALLFDLDAIRREDRFVSVLETCQCIAASVSATPVDIKCLREARNKIATVDVQPALNLGLKGAQLGNEIKNLRLKAL